MSKTKDQMTIHNIACPYCNGQIMNNYKSRPWLAKCLSCHRELIVRPLKATGLQCPNLSVLGNEEVTVDICILTGKFCSLASDIECKAYNDYMYGRNK